MKTHGELKERVRREQQLAARLRLATERLEEAQRERIWAIVETHQSGLSIRQIAAATGLSPSRIHQLLGSEEAREIPRWLSRQRVRSDHPKPGGDRLGRCCQFIYVIENYAIQDNYNELQGALEA